MLKLLQRCPISFYYSYKVMLAELLQLYQNVQFVQPAIHLMRTEGRKSSSKIKVNLQVNRVFHTFFVYEAQ